MAGICPGAADRAHRDIPLNSDSTHNDKQLGHQQSKAFHVLELLQLDIAAASAARAAARTQEIPEQEQSEKKQPLHCIKYS